MRPPIRPECMNRIDDCEAVDKAKVEVLSGEVEGQDEVAEGQEGASREGDAETDHEDDECAPKTAAKDPGAPTQAEIDEHEVDHLPYRSWCECCVMGRGTGEQHRPGPSSRVPVISFDYLFIAQSKILTEEELGVDEAKAAAVKVLVVKDSKSKAIFAHVVRRKGVDDDEYAVRRLVEDVNWLGYSKVILKCDGERAIIRLMRESLKRIRTEVVEVSFEHPPTYDPRSNGSIENAVKQLKGYLRTLKLSLERKVGKRVPDSHAAFSWLVEHAAWLLTVRKVGEDGQSPYQRVRGRPFTKRLVEFGERALYKLHMRGPHFDHRGAMEERWQRGQVLGFTHHSNQYYMWTGEQVVKARVVQRLKRDSRWHLEGLERINVDVHSQYPAAAEPAGFEGEVDRPEAVEPERRAPQSLAVRQADWAKYGSTPGCIKCSHADAHGWGKMGGAHSTACLERFERLLSESAVGKRRVEEARRRRQRWTDEQEAREQPRDADREVPQRFEEMGEADARPLPPSPQEWSDVPGGDRAPVTPGRDDDGPESIAGDQDDGNEQDDAMDDDAGSITGREGSPDEEMHALNTNRDVGGAMGVPPDEPPGETSKAPGETLRGTPELQEILSLVDEGAQASLVEDDVAVFKLISELGGGGKAYARERKTNLNKIVSEVFSPPRVTRAIKLLPGLKLIPGLALDVTRCNEKGEPWDFDDPKKQEEALQLFEKQKPVLLVGSPPCTPYSILQRLNDHKRTPQETEDMMARAKVHMDFVCRLYKMQIQAGRYFLHEHPATATSWELKCVQEVLHMDGVDVVHGDQCQYGQVNGNKQPIKKGTGWMANSKEILRALRKRCKGRGGECSAGGRHAPCTGRDATRAAIYPFKLCRAILEGLRNQLRTDRKMAAGVHGMGCDVELDVLMQEQCEEWFNVRIADELNVADNQVHYKDAITGQPLDPVLVKAARSKELEYFAMKDVWHYRPRSEALARMGKPPITVKWVDVNKGDDIEPNYRSRLVAREIRRPGEDSIFAPTPPLESLRTVLSLATTDVRGHPKHVREGNSEDRTQVMVVDISRAYFNAKKAEDKDPTYVDLPPEDPHKAQGDCGLLRVHMYGTRAAADGWHSEYSNTLVDLGFRKGDASACVFRHPARRMVASVHGDDFTIAGPKRYLDELKAAMQTKYELTELARLGPGDADDKEVKILNRVIRWTKAGIEYEADPRQGEKVVAELGLTGASPAGTPGIKRSFDEAASEKPLDVAKHKVFRGISARGNYLSADRPEVQYATKEICRFMAKPTDQGVAALKRLGRYLEGRRRLIFDYPFQQANQVEIYSDTDWAGCVKTRRSTSGGCMLLGSHLIKSWSSTQSTISLSSGEAEFYGVVKSTGIALGYQALMKDLGVSLPVRVWTDSSASMGICGRQGLGKLRHIDTKSLWVQQKVRGGAIELRKVRGEVNPADLYTKHLSSSDRVEKLLNLVGCRYADGRAAAAPQLREAGGSPARDALLACGDAKDMIYSTQGPTISQEGYVYPATTVDGILVAEAYLHDDSVLPHQVPGNIDLLFPKAVAAPEFPEIPELQDPLEVSPVPDNSDLLMLDVNPAEADPDVQKNFNYMPASANPVEASLGIEVNTPDPALDKPNNVLNDIGIARNNLDLQPDIPDHDQDISSLVVDDSNLVQDHLGGPLERCKLAGRSEPGGCARCRATTSTMTRRRRVRDHRRHRDGHTCDDVGVMLGKHRNFGIGDVGDVVDGAISVPNDSCVLRLRCDNTFQCSRMGPLHRHATLHDSQLSFGQNLSRSVDRSEGESRVVSRCSGVADVYQCYAMRY